MTINTAERRLSALDHEMIGANLPLPDGVIDATDRTHLIWLYAGIVPITIVDTPGCAVISVQQLHTADVMAALLYQADVTAQKLHTATITIQECAPFDGYTWPVTSGPVMLTMPGTLRAIYSGRGLTLASTWGVQAITRLGERLYIGLSNHPGGPEDGALVVSTADGIDFDFEVEPTEQGVHDISNHGGDLWIPGTDPTDNPWTLGNLYRLTGGVWSKISTLANVIHDFGLYHDGTHLFVGTGSHAGDLTTWLGQVFKSADNGATWDAPVTISSYRVYDVIGWQTRLYALTEDADMTHKVQYSTDDGATWATLAGLTPSMKTRMTAFGDNLVGRTAAGGLFGIDASYAATVYTPGFTPLDDFNILAVVGSYLYVLASDGAIYKTADLATWSLVLTMVEATCLAAGDDELLIGTDDNVWRLTV